MASDEADREARHLGRFEDATAAFVVLLGLGLIVHPGLLAGRFAEMYESAAQVARGFGGAVVAFGLCAAAWPRLQHARLALQCATAAVAYVALALIFSDWHIDDAAITYAYAENLVRGYGLVLHPSHAPQEGYSTTLWMLILAGCRYLGFDVAGSAKVLGIAIGALVPITTCVLLDKVSKAPVGGAAFTVTLATSMSAPFVIWSTSGLEHGLQALLLLGLVWGASRRPVMNSTLAWCGSALVLTRPEAPLVVAASCSYLGFEAWSRHRRLRDVVTLWPTALIPAAVFVALLTFRIEYFGDPLPNPFYAKAQGATFLRLVNPFGVGWRYVTSWLAQGGGFLPLAVVVGLGLRELPYVMRPALAVLAGQVAFVVYAGGDWMAQWRFLAAPIALLALMAGHATQLAATRAPIFAKRYAGYIAVVSVICNVTMLITFRNDPTTPYTKVAAIGKHFADLGRTLGIEHPVLAHHDAGGTSYRARIDVLDLGGLGNRDIAKHMHDPAFLRAYILEQHKPAFVFGSKSQFAAGTSRFFETERFARDYVPLIFDGLSEMRSDLCYMRRELAHDAPGVVVEHEGGQISAVHVK